MGSCCSCPNKEIIPDNQHNKFKVINVDDDGNELGSGVMELTEEELILHTHKRDTVRWSYLCLRRYGYDSNLFSFESGRRCQTGQGIFAFKCARAEEIFNMLQDIMHNNSISVVEEPVLEPELPNTPAAPGYSVPMVANGIGRFPSFCDASSRPSSRHPSLGSTRLPSLGEESTHTLLLNDETVRIAHTVTLYNKYLHKLTTTNNYENLPALPPVWETLKSPSLNGFLFFDHNCVNTESLHNTQHTVFNFDLHRFGAGCQLDYIEVEMDKVSDSSGPHTPKTPTTRRTELYAIIDIQRTAAMSILQKAQPWDDGTSRKTQHNSTELPM
ncbi:fibroblast growth factor receptor substrate 2-like [Carassius carassius]|uniref:fibroblast growth factor receptor substrate 2-like n=1 Tax=Carassius carassius TaxID=217509 RepID=UPI0028687963|nr:fibroblast growth factor receptor substrate 2-like [Carassius carassius]